MRLTEDEFALMLKNSKCRISGEVSPKRKGRVRSRRIHLDGLIFDSTAEMMIYREYKFDPKVLILETHPVFLLQKGFKRHGKRHQPITYTADLLIKEEGREIVVEVKSKGTLKANAKSYSMRKKMFLKLFPDLLFREIIIDGKSRIINEL